MTNHSKPAVQRHTLEAKAVFERLDSGENGLDETQAKQRMERAGPNSLDVETGVSPLRI